MVTKLPCYHKLTMFCEIQQANLGCAYLRPLRGAQGCVDQGNKGLGVKRIVIKLMHGLQLHDATLGERCRHAYGPCS